MGRTGEIHYRIGHPPSTAFIEGTRVIPQVLLEFWYTCRVEGSAGDIMNDRENTVRITLNHLRKILRLSVLPKYDLEVSKSQASSVLLETAGISRLKSVQESLQKVQDHIMS